MLILGLNLFHSDSSATLLSDGRVVMAVAEERLNRVKHFAGVPALAIRACLDAAGAKLSDVDHVALGRDPDSHSLVRLRYGAKNPKKLLNLVRLRNRGQSLKDLRPTLAAALDEDPATLRFKQHNIEHHVAHIASAYFCSPWEKAAGFSNDGSGDFVSIMSANCEGNSIDVLRRTFIPHSLGGFYTTICDFIGYSKYGDEGKVMGLAALGDDSFHEAMEEMVRLAPHSIELALRYFVPMGSNQGIEIAADGEVLIPRMYSDAMVDRFGPPRQPRSEITQRDKDLAASMQVRFETAFFHLLNGLHREVDSDDIVMAGGCALNSVANGKMFAATPYQRSWIQPAAGDEGLSLGAALYCWHSILGKQRDYVMTDAYLGPEFSESAMSSDLKAAGLTYVRLDRDALIATTAEAIERGRVVGWFQGRMEWGPRALGNRSILAHPGLPDMKDILNSRIKHRESFRPFAPAILEERLADYFESAQPSPFMLHVYKIRPEKRDELVAVTHVDGTGRLQSVSRVENPLYYDLIREFGRRTGTPVLLNTSFNENEPIVCTPREAIDCFLRTKMDLLVMGNLVVERASGQD
ncbi:MAG: carbamoyltransferase [Actinomycetota bacterium]|nr:carbamoyltransferase [Actinomycetota bacterium]